MKKFKSINNKYFIGIVFLALRQVNRHEAEKSGKKWAKMSNSDK